MEQISTIRVTLNVTYSLNGEAAEAIAERLRKTCERLAVEAVMQKNDTAELEQWSMGVEVVKQPSPTLLHLCDNCGQKFREDDLEAVEDYFARIDPGGVVPSGLCPDCWALCYPDDEDMPSEMENTKEVAQ